VYISLMQPALRLFSILHQYICRIRNIFYSSNLLPSEAAPLPVVSVGNITFGGSGKTPLAQELIRYLQEQNLKTALVSRGYRGNWEKQGGVLSDGRSLRGDWHDAGDEPFMIALRHPQAGVYVGKNRLTSCRRANSDGFQVAVLDDGFQHRRLKRDLDIVLYDPDEQIRLREPLSALKRADIILVKQSRVDQVRQDLGDWFEKSRIFAFETRALGLCSLGTQEDVSLSAWANKNILAFSGIARPDRFSKLLGSEGIQPKEFIAFPDHFAYPTNSLARIREQITRISAEAAITTEKDAVKLSGFALELKIPFYYLRIGLDVNPEFYSLVLSSLGLLTCA
jgi:tetraacyldisaccharide 4'-kinase